MRTTPQSFYELFVVGNFQDYESESDDIRRGFNAAVAAFQMADIFWAYYERVKPELLGEWREKKDLLIHLCTIEPSFSTIQSVATVYKHLYVNGGHYEVVSPGAVWAVSIPNGEV